MVKVKISGKRDYGIRVFCAAIGRLSDRYPTADYDGHELAECIYSTEIIRYVLF